MLLLFPLTKRVLRFRNPAGRGGVGRINQEREAGFIQIFSICRKVRNLSYVYNARFKRARISLKQLGTDYFSLPLRGLV